MAKNDGVYWQRHYLTQRDPHPKEVFEYWADPGSGSVTIQFWLGWTEENKPPAADPPDGFVNVTPQLTYPDELTELEASGGTEERWKIIDAANVLAGGILLYTRIELDTTGANDADYSGGRQWRYMD